MAGPIPVFSFVFAAYAATSGGSVRAAISGEVIPWNPRAPFRTVWRTQSARGNAVFAKVGLIKGSGGRDPQLAVNGACEAREEFWVGGIVESGLGFVGSPVATRSRPPETAAGLQVRFHVINVLDWRIGVCPELCPKAQAPCPHPEPERVFAPSPEILPPLSETAGP